MTMNDTGRADPALRRRCRFMVMVAFSALVLLVGCSSGAQISTADETETEATAADTDPADTDTDADPADTETDTEATADSAQPISSEDSSSQPDSSESDPEPTPTPHPIAVADTQLPDAPIGFESLFEDVTGPQPVSIEIEDIGVQDALVIPVGVNEEDLSFEVPPADEVGWYEFGPAPGEPGSAVLAAHIAYNGVDGVFRYLEDVEIGAIVVVGFDDGSSERYRIEEVTEYVKEALPDSLFAREGKEQLALITCGGAFNYQLDSYESNTVAIAVPVDV